MDKKEKIAIWGTGALAKKIVALHCNVEDIECFYDNDERKCGTYIMGIPVVKYDENFSGGTHKIIITSSYWREIVLQLKQSGLEAFKDYTLWNFYFDENTINYSEFKDFVEISAYTGDFDEFKRNKKIAVTYGNCQTAIIESALTLYSDFIKDYIMIKLPKVCEYNSAGRCLLEKLINDFMFWKSVDLLIYQTVRKDNRFSPILCTDDILSKVRKDCIKVNILNLYFAGYFPQADTNSKRVLSNMQQGGIFAFRDKCVDELILNRSYSNNEIVDLISSENYISSNVIADCVNSSLTELKKREENVDVKIFDYISENYNKRQLFYSFNHPCEEVLLEYINRIILFLGYKSRKIKLIDFILKVGSLKGQDIPIYPCVIKHLGLTDYEELFYPNRYLEADVLLNFKEYIELYIKMVENEDALMEL